MPNMPIVIGRITTHYGAAADSALVRNAQVNAANLFDHVSWVNTDDLQQNLPWPWHYGTQGQIDLGIRFANEFINVPEPSTILLGIGGGLLLGKCRSYKKTWGRCSQRVFRRQARNGR